MFLVAILYFLRLALLQVILIHLLNRASPASAKVVIKISTSQLHLSRGTLITKQRLHNGTTTTVLAHETPETKLCRKTSVSINELLTSFHSKMSNHQIIGSDTDYRFQFTAFH